MLRWGIALIFYGCVVGVESQVTYVTTKLYLNCRDNAEFVAVQKCFDTAQVRLQQFRDANPQADKICSAYALNISKENVECANREAVKCNTPERAALLPDPDTHRQASAFRCQIDEQVNETCLFWENSAFEECRLSAISRFENSTQHGGVTAENACTWYKDMIGCCKIRMDHCNHDWRAYVKYFRMLVPPSCMEGEAGQAFKDSLEGEAEMLFQRVNQAAPGASLERWVFGATVGLALIEGVIA